LGFIVSLFHCESRQALQGIVFKNMDGTEATLVLIVNCIVVGFGQAGK
jgi:hypothetical protein